MSAGTRLLLGLASCAGLMMSACMLAPQRSVSPAFFTAAPQDSDTVQAFAREQERQVQICAAAHACDRAHYLRALAALYEDRQVAMTHFQAAAKIPNGRYAASSLQWIRLLEDGKDGAQYQAALSQATERLVRDVIEREKDVQAIQSLKQELKVREKRIDELTQQIDALKRVDQEVKDRVKPSRPGN
jgi:hypothetical protein